MGLMDLDIERVERKQRAADQQYRYGSSALRKEAAPDEAAVKAYNTQVEGFKNSAFHRADRPEEVWQIIGGWISPNGAYALAPVRGDSAGYNYYGPGGVPDFTYYHGAGTGMYAGQDPYINGQTGGWNMWYQNAAGKTLRSADDGSAVIGRPNLQSNMYASWDDRPFVAPITAAQKEAATAADTRLKDVGVRGEGLMAEHTAATQRTEKEADRLAMTPGIGDNTTSAPRSDAFADTNVFQSIVDWLK